MFAYFLIIYLLQSLSSHFLLKHHVDKFIYFCIVQVVTKTKSMETIYTFWNTVGSIALTSFVGLMYFTLALEIFSTWPVRGFTFLLLIFYVLLAIFAPYGAIIVIEIFFALMIGLATLFLGDLHVVVVLLKYPAVQAASYMFVILLILMWGRRQARRHMQRRHNTLGLVRKIRAIY